MLISLAGEGPQFTNKFFNTIEVQPNSFVCLTNISVKKNESVTLSSDTPFYFYVDYNNIYKIDIPKGEYTINSLVDAFNLESANMCERFDISASIRVIDESRRFVIKVENVAIPDLDFGIRPEDSSGDPFDIDYNSTWGPMNNGDPVDIAGVASFKDIGTEVSTQGYLAQSGFQSNIPFMPNGNQTLSMNSFLTAGAPLYVPRNLSGTPDTDALSNDQTLNKVQDSLIQASFQYPYIKQPSRTPIPATQINPNQLQTLYQTDLNRHSGVLSFVIGCGQSMRDYVIMTAEEALDASGTGQTFLYPADFEDPTNAANTENIFTWLKWGDPRSGTTYQSFLKIGFWALDNSVPRGKTWTYADARLDDKNEERLCVEGCKYTVIWKPNQDTTIPESIYHPEIFVDHLTHKLSTNDRFTNTICFWNMDGPFIGPPDTSIFYNASHESVAGTFKDSSFQHSGYEFLWNNVGANNYDGFKNSGNYWGTEFNQAGVDDGYNKGRGFELRTGAGTIDFRQSNGITNTPGAFTTAFGVSRSSNSGATGYQNAYYKFPDMWGGKTLRSSDGEIQAIPDGTILPATYNDRALGSYFMTMCFRLDDITEAKYQIIFAYEGSDPATGTATEPHTMLGVTIGSDKFLCSDGGPTSADRDEVDITKVSDGTPYTIAVSKWIQVAIVFQKAAGPNASQWIIVGVDEDGVEFKALPTVGRTPTKPIFGIGGNDKCDGTQTTSTGLVGNIKFLKIGYYFGEDLTSNTNYDVGDLILNTCTELNSTKTNGVANDFNYTNDIQTSQILGDVFTKNTFGYGQPNSMKPLTVVMGSVKIEPTKIVNSNPYDALFTAPIFRQNYLLDLDKRYVGTQTDPIVEYLKGGTKEIALGKVGFINNVAGEFIDIAGYGTDDQLLDLNSLNIRDVGELVAPSTVDTEVGLNDNRIHIDNLPIQSYNGKVGAVDRAIYQTSAVLPVREVGENYVVDSQSVPQKVWIPITNAGNMYLNEFNVKITDLDNVVDEEIISAQLNIEIKDEKEMMIAK